MKGISYIISSCGKTVHHEENCITSYEDEFGDICKKYLPRPAMAHVLLDFPPLIDEHNKQHQNVLALEESWVTMSGFTRNLTTFTGMRCVDIQWWDRSIRTNANRLKPCNDGPGDFDTKQIVNFIVKPIKIGKLKYYRRVPRQGPMTDVDNGPLT